MSDLLIFDQHDNLLSILSNDAEGACPFWDAPFKETLNKGSEFEFTAPADHEDSKYLVAENQVVFMDKDGAFRLFIIKEPERSNGADGPQIQVFCEPAMFELHDEIIEDVRPYNTTAKDALTRALNGCRWEVGEVAELGNNSTNYYYINVAEAVTKIINTWGGELRDRVEIEENKIVGRYIDILPRRGSDTGKRWEIDKDILSIKHKVQSYPKTALYGRGSSLEVEDEEGNHTGGYSRKITFADVVWSKENGDPADKPKGQEWIGDPEALSTFGRKNSDGTFRHRVGVFDNADQEDPEVLLLETWEELQKQKRPFENYEMDVFLLEEIAGYEHEKVRLGDTTFALDRSFSRPIEIEARVIVFEYDVSDPDNTGTVEMGQYIDLYADDRRLDEIEAKLNEKSGIWDRGGTKPITDDRIENVPPTKVENVIATGAFKNIIVEWDFVGTIAIANYEVYASKIQGFTPDASNLVFRGKTSVYTHKADNNEQWYFKVRAVNTHGVYGPFSSEAMAQTARIISDDILFGPDVAAELRELSKTAQLLAENTITEVQIQDGQVSARLMAANSITAANGALANASITRLNLQQGIVGTLQIDDLAVTNAKIGDLAVDDAKISDLSVTKLKAGTIDTSKINIFGGTTTEYTKIEGAFLESRGKFTRTWQGNTYNHDVALQFQNGYFVARSLNDDRNLYYSNFGISTYASGNQDESSGTIEFFSYDYHTTRKGITISSVGGVVALRSGLEKVIIDAYDHAYLKSNQQQVRIQPRNHVVGNNTFAFHVVDNADPSLQDGILYFGSENNPSWSAGLRFSKQLNSNTLSITNGTGAWGTGNLEVYDLKVNNRMIGGIEAPVDNAYAYVNNAFKVVDKSGNNLRDLEIRNAIMNEVIFGSLRTADTETNTYIGVGSYELRITNNQFYNSGDTVYRSIRARSFITDTSIRENKKDIEVYSENVLEIFRNANVYTYRRKNDNQDAFKQLGMMIDETPRILHGESGDSFELYALTSYIAKGLMDHIRETDEMKDDINWLKLENQYLRARIEQLEAKAA